ncbi:hypothetical protein ACN9KO_000536 [Yersinia enterocolitica]
MNNIEERIESLKANVELSKMVTLDELTVSVSDLDALIAQLEAAENLISEDGKLQYIRRLEAEKQTESSTINLQRRMNLELMTENAGLKERAEKAEAALSAANEKLSKPVVLPPRRSASYFVDEEFSNEDLAASYNAARLEFSVKVKNAGFTVEGE